MQYSLSLLAAALLAGIASAQNPFSFTTLSTVTAGTPFNITWSPSTGTTDTITLLLRQGDPAHLTTVATIACLLPFPFPTPSFPTPDSFFHTNGILSNSKHPKHRLLPLDALHLPRPRLRLRIRNHRRWKYTYSQLFRTIHAQLS
jgi:hypothetical protein